MNVEATIHRSLDERRSVVRRIYVLTAGMFLAAAVVGFGPNSVAILSGAMPLPPLIVHIHAALMLAWLLLFTAQTLLMATGRPRVHQALGLASFVLAPAMAVMMIATTVARYDNLAQFLSPAFATNFALSNMIGVATFISLFVWAVSSRHTAPETHKRVMVLITAYVLGAATGRMAFLPSNGLAESYNYMPIVYALCLIAPAVIHDLWKLGRVHSAYVIGLAVIVGSMVLTTLLWDWPWWHRTASAWLGAT